MKHEQHIIIDLFSGCGGFSTGFEMVKDKDNQNVFKVALAIEKDEWAADTYKLNHKNGTYVINQDITTIDSTQMNDIKNIINQEVCGIIGGPPCQGFSLSGNRDKNDPRNSLFMEFVKFVNYFNPKFFVMENVRGILSMKTKNNDLVKDLIINELKNATAIGYNIKVVMLNAAEFGIPQSRLRVFFIGIRKDLNVDVNNCVPHGFLFNENQITLEQAIMDLPQIDVHTNQDINTLKYNCTYENANEYQKLMRGGSIKNEPALIHNHETMKHTKRLIDRFSQIQYGESVADIKNEEHKQRKRGNVKETGSVYAQNNMRPFPNKPAPTITASFQSNFIHPYLNRNFTAREGARIQSFPDNYIFCGKRTTMSWEKNLSQYQQIGNAVPPLLAKAIGEQIAKQLSFE